LFILGAFGLAGMPLSGVALGHDLMSDAAASLHYGWTRWVFIAAECITAAAVLRAAGHIFFGWGPHDVHTGAKNEEKPETRQGNKKTPATMFIPAAVLLISGLLVGLAPRLQPAVVRAADAFENSAAYSAHVLNGSVFPNLPAPFEIPPAHTITAIMTVLGAIAIAIIHLSHAGIRQIGAKFAVPLKVMHRVHNGNVVDYVVFLTMGMAIFGLICAYLVR
jgi:hypothetical protein